MDGMVGYIWGKWSGFVTTRDNVCEFVEIVGGDWGRFDGGGGGAERWVERGGEFNF